MEWINEFIYLSAAKDTEVFETACIATQDDFHIYLTYTLFDNDCIIDLTNTSNKAEIKINKTYFEKYEQPFDIVIEKQSICCNTQFRLYELINCQLIGISRKIYLESIVLHLLFQIQKNNLVFRLNCDSCIFLNQPIELDKIQKAKEFIANNLDQNLTIPIIAKYVGTNQCYLKKGFKEVTGQTIFEYIQENRMVKAKHILQNSSISIQEIASIIGYSSISSFSQAYKNYFGISPSVEQKQIITNS